jgi:crotonobetainyl-CoA:carnitine CoA-transferase CaiB-like acyl-CoA transferase
MAGPRRDQPGYDYVIQGLAGWMSLTGEPDGPPTKTGVSLVDFSGGLAAALSLVTGLHAAQRTGVGMDCDVSLYDTAISMLNYLAGWHLNAGFQPGRRAYSAHPSLVPFQNFRTADSWIVIACPKEKFWKLFVEALGHPPWADDERFATFAGRYEHDRELVGLIEEALARKTTAIWVEELTAAGVPCAPIHTVAEALADEHTEARQLVVSTPHPRWGTVRQVATAARVGPARTAHVPAPSLGEHTDAVLEEVCGYDRATRQTLRHGGAFGVDSSSANR